MFLFERVFKRALLVSVFIVLVLGNLGLLFFIRFGPFGIHLRLLTRF